MLSPLSSRILAGLAGLFAATALNGQILNGGFETPATPPGNFTQYLNGQVIGGAWTVGGNDVIAINTTYTEPGVAFNAFNGNTALDITGAGNTGANTISQTIPFLGADSYVLSFYLGRINGGPNYVGAPVVGVTIDGVPQGVFTNPNPSPGVVDWLLVQVPFSIGAGSHTFTFTNLTPGTSNFAGLDDISVSVAAVPEPTTWLAAGAALALVGGTVVRRRKQA